MPVIVVAAAAIVDDVSCPTSLLAARRSAPPNVAGFWEFPGGKVEDGESVVEALHREVREELGVSVRLGPEVSPPIAPGWPLGNPAGGDAAVMRLWLAEIVSGQPRPLEDHDELRWLPAGQWRSVPWLPGDIAAIEALELRLAAP